ncbi:MAG: large conductance mechanosensitive channel protein MscL [Actinomycetota bacterium]|nr:large conductance mechanosensitive channel protein MscL [Actinomycetota bacterium]
MKGFKDFLLRGNVVELAVAVVIGAAFTALVSSFTSSFVTPLIGLLGGGGDAGGTATVNGQVFTWGAFIGAIITFVLTAAVIYFAVVLPMKKIAELRARGEEAGPTASTDVELLTEIRDLLRSSAGMAAAPAPSVGAHGERLPPQV